MVNLYWHQLLPAGMDDTHAIKRVSGANWGHDFTQMPHRKQRRPATRWDDDLRSFAANNFGIDDWLDFATFSHQRRRL